MRILATICLLPAVLFVSTLDAATWTVCSAGCDWSTIQKAVNAATPGDTVRILASTHTEYDIFLRGGNVYSAGDATILHTYVSDGFADFGGGIYNEGSLTFSGGAWENEAGVGGGIFLEPCVGLCAPSSNGQAHIRNTIFSYNVDRSPTGLQAHHCRGDLVSEGYNLVFPSSLRTVRSSAISPEG